MMLETLRKYGPALSLLSILLTSCLPTPNGANPSASCRYAESGDSKNLGLLSTSVANNLPGPVVIKVTDERIGTLWIAMFGYQVIEIGSYSSAEIYQRCLTFEAAEESARRLNSDMINQ